MSNALQGVNPAEPNGEICVVRLAELLDGLAVPVGEVPLVLQSQRLGLQLESLGLRPVGVLLGLTRCVQRLLVDAHSTGIDPKTTKGGKAGQARDEGCPGRGDRLEARGL